MYLLIGENKGTSKREIVAKYKNLASCLKEINRLNTIYGDTTRFLWRTSLASIV